MFSEFQMHVLTFITATAGGAHSSSAMTQFQSFACPGIYYWQIMYKTIIVELLCLGSPVNGGI